MSSKNLILIKIITAVIVITALVISGKAFIEHRNYKEAVIAGPSVTEVKTLGDYYQPLKNTVADCNIYILDSGKPGSTLFVIGGSHPEEPAANLSAEIFAENAVLEKGKLIIAIRANRSASTVTRPGDAYPQFYTIKTDWGEKKYRMGDRWTNPLDSWPDPEVYVHYPSEQMLAYMDIRNFNRTWPGKKDGSFTEQVNHAFMQIIDKENVDLFIDYHEAELEYPVISTIVAHESGRDIAAMASMTLTDMEFEKPISMEYSPKSLHGLSHREVGDHSDAVSLLFETPEPFLDRVRGVTDEKLLLEGKDPFVQRAGEFGLLYETIDEDGWPIEVRVGRHCSSTLMVAQIWNQMNPGKEVIIKNVPKYSEIVENGVGHYFDNPEKANSDRVYYE